MIITLRLSDDQEGMIKDVMSILNESTKTKTILHTLSNYKPMTEKIERLESELRQARKALSAIKKGVEMQEEAKQLIQQSLKVF